MHHVMEDKMHYQLKRLWCIASFDKHDEVLKLPVLCTESSFLNGIRLRSNLMKSSFQAYF